MLIHHSFVWPIKNINSSKWCRILLNTSLWSHTLSIHKSLKMNNECLSSLHRTLHLQSPWKFCKNIIHYHHIKSSLIIKIPWHYLGFIVKKSSAIKCQNNGHHNEYSISEQIGKRSCCIIDVRTDHKRLYCMHEQGKWRRQISQHR